MGKTLVFELKIAPKPIYKKVLIPNGFNSFTQKFAKN